MVVASHNGYSNQVENWQRGSIVDLHETKLVEVYHQMPDSLKWFPNHADLHAYLVRNHTLLMANSPHFSTQLLDYIYGKLQHVTKELQHSKNELQHSKNELQHSKNELQHKNNELKLNNESLESELSETKSELSETKSELSSRNLLTKRLAQELIEANEQIELLDCEIEQVHEEVRSVKEALGFLPIRNLFKAHDKRAYMLWTQMPLGLQSRFGKVMRKECKRFVFPSFQRRNRSQAHEYFRLAPVVKKLISSAFKTCGTNVELAERELIMLCDKYDKGE